MRSLPAVASLRALGLVALAGLALGVGSEALSGQALAEAQVPAGRVRVDFVPSFWSWNSRYGGGEGLSEEESLGVDLTDPVGTTLFPSLEGLRDNLRALTGDAGYTPALGQTLGSVTKELSRIDAGLKIGIFDWLTVGANVPFVKGRTAVDVAFRPDPAGDLGLNPAVTDQGAVTDLLSRLENAANAAQAYAAGLCGADDPGCADAQALAARASSFRSDAEQAYFASPFFPTGGSEVGTALSAALASLNEQLSAAGLSGVTGGLAFAESPMDGEDFASLSATPGAGYSGGRLETVDGEWAMGDVELSTSVRVLQGEVRDSGAVRPDFAFSVSVGGLVRLGTGTIDDRDLFLDIGSGDGQRDMEGRVDGFLQVGRRLDLRGGFRYGVQNSVVLLRRVAAPRQIFVPRTDTRAVEWTPGSYTFIDVSPRYRFTPELSLGVDYRRYHKGADTYELVGAEPDGIPSVDPSLLERETEMTAQEVALGLRYSTVRSWRAGVDTRPMEMGMRLVRTVAGSGGQVPNMTRFEFSVSFLKRIWGGP